MSDSAIENLPYTGDGAQLGMDLRADDVRGVAADLMTIGADVATVLTDPIGVLEGVGLGFLLDHFAPLKEAIDLVSGDPEALRASADTWRAAAGDVRQIGISARRGVESGTQRWHGVAGDACRARLVRFDVAAGQIALECEGLAELLESSATLMTTAHDIVLGIVTTLVTWLLASWAAATAAAAPTFGASEAAFVPAAELEIATTTWRVEESVGKVHDLLVLLNDAIVKGVAFMVRVPHALDFSDYGGSGDTVRR